MSWCVLPSSILSYCSVWHRLMSFILWILSVFLSLSLSVHDFSVNMLVHSSNRDHVLTLCSHYNLTQVVTNSTYNHNDGYNSLLDLLLVSDPAHVLQCNTILPLSNSDHNGLLFQLDCSLIIKKARPRITIWRYAYTDSERACTMLESLDLDAIFSSSDINICWDSWKQRFMGIMEACISCAILPDTFSPPWISRKIIQNDQEKKLFS